MRGGSHGNLFQHLPPLMLRFLSFMGPALMRWVGRKEVNSQ
nr:MAG TPA: hypothetical protein [Caudoviricetes sp.]